MDIKTAIITIFEFTQEYTFESFESDLKTKQDWHFSNSKTTLNNFQPFFPIIK
jgi:hypothetical protein